VGGTLLTAALIVADEERHLGACLESLAGVVDQTVVVDTGSTDGTAAIAREGGAEVHEQAWTGDFSAARNAALDRAKGNWILYIDADERLRPTARADVETLLCGAAEVAFRMLLHPFAHATPYREYRLWRNDPRIRFRGVIHEKVMPAIHEVADAEGRRVGDCRLALDHVGYDGDQTHKHRRNLPLLRAQLADEPDNVFNLRHLGRVLTALGEQGEAEEALRRAVRLTRDAPEPGVHGSLAYADLAEMLHERGEPVGELVSEGLAFYPGNWLLAWTRARLEIDAGHEEQALEWLDRLLAVDRDALPDAGVAYDGRLFGSFAHASRGLCLFRLGRYAESERAYRAAERCEPGNPEHAVKARVAAMRAARAPAA
jgi:tetratricopeptide (TPR) repeat protein